MVDDEPPTLTLAPQLSQVATVTANLASGLYYLRAAREDTHAQALHDEHRQLRGAGGRRVEEDLERAGGRERDIDRAATWLRGLPAALAQQVRGDPAWAALAVRLHDVARAGHDPAAVLAHLAKVRGLDDAESVAQVLHWRIGRFIDGDARLRAGFADQTAEQARAGDPTAAPRRPVVLQRVGRPAADDAGIVQAELVDDGAAEDPSAAAASWAGQARVEDAHAEQARQNADEAATRPDAAATPHVDEHQQGVQDAASDLADTAAAIGRAGAARFAAVIAARAALGKARAAFAPVRTAATKARSTAVQRDRRQATSRYRRRGR